MNRISFSLSVNETEEPLPVKAPSLREQGFVPIRYLVALLSFFGMVFNYMLRVNINLTIVAMVKPSNSSNSSIEDVCHFGNGTEDQTSESEGDFEWNEFTQSMITGSFFWGYIWTQIPGGRLAEIFGFRRVFGGALVLASIISCFVPMAAKAGSGVLIMVRILLGVAEGPTFPSTHVLLANWAPPLERSIISTIIYAGSQAGTIIAYPMASAIIQSLGWEAVFYIQAGLTLGWCALWFLIVADTPLKSKWISEAEKHYIMSSMGDSKDLKAPPVPIKSILTSPPFWAIFVAGVGNNWGFYTLLTDLPLYMKNMLKQDIKSNALLSGMPYLGMWIFSLLMSLAGDKLRMAGKLSTVAVRKIANSIAHMGPAVCLLILTAITCDRNATIALLFVAVGLQGGIYTGFMVNHVDIAPNFAGTLFGITNAAATIPGWLAPMTVGALTTNQQTFEQWNKVFYISAAWFIVDAVVFLIFASGTEQPWNIVSSNATEDKTDEAKTKRTDTKKLVQNTDSPSTSKQQPDAYDTYVTSPQFRNTFTNDAYEKDLSPSETDKKTD
ncbi:putative inorganic phosphate cotransporter [Palaemon carinicauda]|uniref:putative inorganic phosphate cotransporter n=1 Tax=Palaemon carinicauda TaxID=392227 RepID=UPI0035B60827